MMMGVRMVLEDGNHRVHCLQERSLAHGIRRVNGRTHCAVWQADPLAHSGCSASIIDCS